MLRIADEFGGYAAEGEADDQIDVSSADMCSGSSGEPADKVARCEAAGEVDALAPRADVAEKCEQSLSQRAVT